jgi:hypothetical protein
VGRSKSEFEDQACRACGISVMRGARFCTQCGSKTSPPWYPSTYLNGLAGPRCSCGKANRQSWNNCHSCGAGLTFNDGQTYPELPISAVSGAAPQNHGRDDRTTVEPQPFSYTAPRPVIPDHIQQQLHETSISVATMADDEAIWAAVDRACRSEAKPRFAVAWMAIRHSAGRSDLSLRGIIEIAVVWFDNSNGEKVVRTEFVSGMTNQSTFMFVPMGEKTLLGVGRVKTYGEALKGELKSLQ